MRLNELMKSYSGNACVSIDGYCEEAVYDYYSLPLNEWGDPVQDIFSGDNPNNYIPTCLAKEPWWKEIEDKEVERWCIIGGGMYKVELCINLQ
jgi:hypothetical protein